MDVVKSLRHFSLKNKIVLMGKCNWKNTTITVYTLHMYYVNH
jgi:hypothetical protein